MKQASLEPTSIRISEEDKTQLDQLVARLEGFGRNSIRRAAMRLGATLLEVDSEALAVAGKSPAERRTWLQAKLDTRKKRG